MSLKSKVNYFPTLSAAGWEVQSTNENREIGSAEAQGDNGFTVAITTFGEKIKPTCDYIATSTANIDNVVIGSVTTVDSKQIALGSISIKTAAGQAPTMTASGSQIEDGGTAHCTTTLSGITVSPLFHAQDFGLFSVSNGQLTDSTLNIDGEIATAEVDGVIKSSDLVGGKVTVTGTVIGVNDSGAISTPTLSINTPSGSVLSGVVTQPLSETNPNGDYPSYSFTITWPLVADS